MINSLDRIYEAMSTALRRDIVPRLKDAHARRQAVALVDLLNHLRLKTDWTPGPIRETVSVQIETLTALGRMLDGSGVEPPWLSLPSLPDRHPSAAELMALRDELDAMVSRALEWIHQHHEELKNERTGAAISVLESLIEEQLRRELQLTPKPLFGEM